MNCVGTEHRLIRCHSIIMTNRRIAFKGQPAHSGYIRHNRHYTHNRHDMRHAVICRWWSVAKPLRAASTWAVWTWQMPKAQVLAHPCSRALVQTNFTKQRCSNTEHQQTLKRRWSNTVEVIQQAQRQRSKPLDAFFMGVGSVYLRWLTICNQTASILHVYTQSPVITYYCIKSVAWLSFR